MWRRGKGAGFHRLAATAGQGCCPWSIVGKPEGNDRRCFGFTERGRWETTDCGKWCPTHRHTARQQGIKKSLFHCGTRGVICCDRTSQSTEGEDRPLAKSWGRTVEVLAIKKNKLKRSPGAAGESVCFGRWSKQTQLLYYPILLNTGKAFRRLAESQV